ncbi:MAG: deoxyribose-phosphate aldolase [Patescibacteria group bacterium]
MNLNLLIDHTLLKPTATEGEIKKLCQEAKVYGFWSVCVNPCWVKLAKEAGVRVASVIGFPLGANTLAIKVAEVKQAIKDGADELDVVINRLENMEQEVKAVVKAASGRLVKIIIETGNLNDKEKVLAAKLVKTGGANFVKTSTGMGFGGATVEDVKLLRKTVGPKFGVKASGGIKNREQAEAMVKAGANRIGTSSGVEICG